MNDFNPDNYRNTLREKLGLKKKIHDQKNFIRPVTSAISTNPEPTLTSDGVVGVGESGAGTPEEVVANPEAETAATEEQLAPALALLDTLLQSVHDQTNEAQDKVVGVMWRSLHNYIWKNRSKIAKKMMDDAQ